MVIFTYQLPSSLSFDNFAEVEADILKQIEGHNYDEIVLDAQGMKYISSAGLRVLLVAQRIMGKKGHMTVRNVNESVMEILTITGFNNVLDIEA